MKQTIINPSTLVPISGLVIAGTFSFWISSWINKISINTRDIDQVKIEHENFESGLSLQLQAQADLLKKIELEQASQSAKLTLLLQLAEEGRRKK